MKRNKQTHRTRALPDQHPEVPPAASARPGRRGPRLAFAFAALLALGTGLMYDLVKGQVPPTDAMPAPPAATYVGAPDCAQCHASESAAWRGSQHAFAMQEANGQSVLGDFNDAKFTYAGTTSRFFRRDDGFYVHTDGPDGKPADYHIKYTFGVSPLQQYLVEFAEGRVQALPIAWDTRSVSEGGQRWFHLHPDEQITHDDELHWTRAAQNWNFMCADCHSTGLRKNYDPVADRFETQWAEIDVACEACHGPASRHLAWAEAKEAGKPWDEDDSKGLTVLLDERRDMSWTVDPATGNAVRSEPRLTERELDVCAQCHARRGQIAEGYVPGKPFLDYYRPALLEPPLYYADGQQRGEVYKWGSFLQSKMHSKGVTCSDCHDPHSGKLRAQGNAVCTGCHLPDKYDTAEHHHHPTGSAGAACAACHMPTTTYMVIDPRHDHSLRVPRPDLSVKFGTPNPCTRCHTDRDAGWAATQVRAWYGHDPQGYQHYTAAFSAAAAGAGDAGAQLRLVAADATQPSIARATALADLEPTGSRSTLEALVAGLHDSNALLRFGALQALAQAPVEVLVPLSAPLLSDPVRTVRNEAVGVLAPVPADRLDTAQRAAFDRASAGYVETQRYNADRAEARVNLGTYEAYRGDARDAEGDYRAALALDPGFVPGYVNLADLYRATGRDADGERTLREGLKRVPDDANLHHALGLALVRLQRTGEALGELNRATELDPGNARFVYVYAVALHSTGDTQAAIATLETALAKHPDDPDILQALASFHAERGDAEAARVYVKRLQESAQ
ncbi:MAG: tetratricopeptide repeat protein [Thiogranum sp.]|jgi:predicted CXXCH cytochrome family protein|nr:tetratricopeptide repeat protein [Thiogranum sp.]